MIGTILHLTYSTKSATTQSVRTRAVKNKNKLTATNGMFKICHKYYITELLYITTFFNDFSAQPGSSLQTVQKIYITDIASAKMSIGL